MLKKSTRISSLLGNYNDNKALDIQKIDNLQSIMGKCLEREH